MLLDDGRLVDAFAEHVTVVAHVQRVPGARARRLGLGQLDGDFRDRRTLPIVSVESVAVGTITLHTQWLVGVHRKKFVHMRQRPLD